MIKLMDDVENRISLLYAKFFELMEKETPDVVKGDKWPSIRVKILDLANAIIRANREDMVDYDIKYRPFRIDQETSNVKMSNSVLNVMNHARFFDDPVSMSVVAPLKYTNVLEAVCDEIGKGRVWIKNGVCALCLDKRDCLEIIPVLNKVPFKSSLRKEYIKWRDLLTETANG